MAVKKKPVFQQWKICKYNLFVKKVFEPLQLINLNIKVKYTTSRSIYLVWNKVNRAVKYEITLLNNNKKFYTTFNEILIKDLRPGKEYKIFVKPILSWNLKIDGVLIKVKTKAVVSIDELPKISRKSGNLSRISDDVVEIDSKTAKSLLVENKVKYDKFILSKKPIKIIKETIDIPVILEGQVNSWDIIILPPKIKVKNTENVVVEPPIDITDKKDKFSDLETKLKSVKKLIEVPTAQKVLFTDYVTICVKTDLIDIKKVKIYYSIDGNNWFLDTWVRNINLDPEKKVLCFDINHFTIFAIWEWENNLNTANWQVNSVSSFWWWRSSWWGGSWWGWWGWWGSWGGWGWGGWWSWNFGRNLWWIHSTGGLLNTHYDIGGYNQKRKFISPENITIEEAYDLVYHIKFKKFIFRIAISKINKLVLEVAEEIYILSDKKLFVNYVNSYIEFLKALQKFENKQVSKNLLKSKLANFIKYYSKYKKLFTNIVKIESKKIKWIRINLYKVYYKDRKIDKIVNDKLDSLILKEMKKSIYTKEDIKKFIKAYNKFKLAVKYMKEKNKKKWRKLAKAYLRQMLTILKK